MLNIERDEDEDEDERDKNDTHWFQKSYNFSREFEMCSSLIYLWYTLYYANKKRIFIHYFYSA